MKLEDVDQYDFRTGLVINKNEKLAWLLKTDGEHILFEEDQMEKLAQLAHAKSVKTRLLCAFRTQNKPSLSMVVRHKISS